MMNRRTFTRRLAGLAGAAAAGTLPGASAAAVAAPETTRSGAGPARPEPMPSLEQGFVDVHTHITQEWWDRPELTAGALVQWMDENQVARAVVLPLENPESWAFPVTTDYVLEETAPYRDRLVPFCSIDPRTVNLGDHQARVDQLRRYVDAGARGFGEHKPGIPIDDPRNREIFAACAEIGLPVLFHMDGQRNTDEPGLPGLASVLRAFPDLPFVGHAPGWWASISGDATAEEFQSYPTTEVTPGGAIDRLMDEHENLYGDLSAGSGANAIRRDLEFGREFLIRRSDRLLFGTDYLAPGQDVPQFELLTETLDLPEEVTRKIFRENARELLGLSG